jgi:Spx/MgsR family transcriptional regulator
MINIYGIKNCDSVKKAIKFFKEHNLEYTLHDFKTIEVTSIMIEKWLQYNELNKLFNKRGTTYRTLKLKEKNLSEDEIKIYLTQEPMLIKRPVVEYQKNNENNVLVAFDLKIYEEVFL